MKTVSINPRGPVGSPIENFSYGYISPVEIRHHSNLSHGTSVCGFCNPAATVERMSPLHDLAHVLGAQATLPAAEFTMEEIRRANPSLASFLLRTNALTLHPLVLGFSGSQAVRAIFDTVQSGMRQLVKIDGIVRGVWINSALYWYVSDSLQDSPPALLAVFGRKLPPADIPILDTAFTIGADPELMLYYSSAKSRKRQKDAPAEGFFDHSRSCSTIVGTDGCTTIFEIRPEPSADPKILTENVRLCIKLLACKISEKKHGGANHDETAFLESGGGAYNSIGGHIHFGGPQFKNTRSLGEAVGKLMDAFLYRPIRERMYGGIRCWSGGVDLPKTLPERLNCSDETLLKYFVVNGINTAWRKTDYDYPTQVRSQAHGIEYRSLPSFVADPELTYLVFDISRGIATWAISAYNSATNLKFKDPPGCDDYLSVTSKENYHSFMRYINGDKRDAFLKDTFANWGIDIRSYSKLTFDMSENTKYLSGVVRANEAIDEEREVLGHKYPVHVSIADRYREASEPKTALLRNSDKATVLTGELAEGDTINPQAARGIAMRAKEKSITIMSYDNLEDEIPEAVAEFFAHAGDPVTSAKVAKMVTKKSFVNMHTIDVVQVAPEEVKPSQGAATVNYFTAHDTESTGWTGDR